MLDLYEKYPEMFKNCYGGVDLPQYWLPVVDRLCGIIKAHRQRLGWAPMEVHQVKEKYAGLRFYNNGEDDYETRAIAAANKVCGSICDNCQSKDRVEVSMKGKWLVNLCYECRQS